jgi:hypothetical protein
VKTDWAAEQNPGSKSQKQEKKGGFAGFPSL